MQVWNDIHSRPHLEKRSCPIPRASSSRYIDSVIELWWWDHNRKIMQPTEFPEPILEIPVTPFSKVGGSSRCNDGVPR